MKEGNVLVNDAFIFYLWLYGLRCMVKNCSDSERENLLLPLHGLLVSISNKRSFMCSIPEKG